MPVDFRELPREEVNDAKPPSPIVWGLLLVIFVAAGTALTLYLWPQGRPAYGWKFFGWFGVTPLVWALCFAARLHSYEIRVWGTQSDKAERDATIQHNTNYARRPLVLLGYAYATAMGQEKLAERTLDGESALATCEVRNTKEVRAHSVLPRTGFASTREQLHEVVSDLLARVKPALQNLRSPGPLEVWLDIQDEAVTGERDTVWESVRNLVGGRVRISLAPPLKDGVMALDAWLDDDSPAAEKYVLLIAVQLRTEVPTNTGEAAVALLLGWSARVERDHVEAISHIHRPVVSPSSPERTALETALDWGKAEPSAVECTWISGLTELRRNADLVVAPRVAADNHPSTASLDSALGHTGAACSWLAIAAGAERCRTGGAIQLISTEANHQPCWLVVRSPFSSSMQSTL